MRHGSPAARRLRLLLAAITVTIGASALWSSTAGAAFHLIKVREVHPGSGNDSYVVLQMLQAGEGFVGGHSLRIYDASGATKYTYTFTGGYAAPNDDHGNNTILVGDTGVQSTFGVAPDDQAEAGFEIDASGGAVCWLDGSPPDCVSWGDFTGNASLPDSAGSPASPGGIPSGQAIRRTISPGCPTYLEAADDTDDSATDFSEVFPDPRPNSEAPSERRCTSSPTQPDEPGDDSPRSPSSGPQPGTAFAASVALVRRGRALVRIRCRGQQGARCRGVLRIVARVRSRRGGRRTVRNIVVGRARYGFPAGRRLRVVRVRLTGQGRRLVRRAGRRGLRTRLVGRGLRNRALVLREARRRARR